VLRRAQPAAVAAVVDGEDAVAGVAQRVVHGDPVEVRRDHPPVQEQERRAVAAGVAHEELAAPGDVDDPPRRRLEGRLGRPPRPAAASQQRGQRPRPPAGDRAVDRAHFA
jgi:hypothetical protein